MLHRELRARVAEIARTSYAMGLCQGTAGNVSARDPESGHILITPSGLPYESMRPEDIVVVDEDGRVIEGDLAPSSETPMHTAVYRSRRWVNGVVHTHSRYATAFACAGQPIRAAHYLVAFAGREVPVAEYATFGTPELAERAVQALPPNGKAVLLKHHGVLTVGSSVEEAFRIASVVEYVAEIYYLALQIGNPPILPNEELDRLQVKFQGYGQPTRPPASP